TLPWVLLLNLPAEGAGAGLLVWAPSQAHWIVGRASGLGCLSLCPPPCLGLPQASLVSWYTALSHRAAASGPLVSSLECSPGRSPRSACGECGSCLLAFKTQKSRTHSHPAPCWGQRAPCLGLSLEPPLGRALPSAQLCGRLLSAGLLGFGAISASLPFAILTLVNTPYKRGFYCGDDSIRYPYRPDTITHGLMAGVTITATVILVSAGEAYLVYTDRLYSRSDFNNYVAALYKVLGTFLFGAAVSQSLTDLAKYMIGRLRPNFLAVCDPDWSRVNCSVYVQLERVCRGSPANVTEAR
ncbi:phospholipid phosphatase 2, partial [Marmota marmota marmota]|uniref:phospholipid phosphatase 2 n=1 Tax=Marmota marmota marmota TaxID=9994 RepID=UPI002093C994